MTSRIGSPDTQADIDVRACLDSSPPRSFVMVAGAGSGKTTSLIKAWHIWLIPVVLLYVVPGKNILYHVYRGSCW